MTDRAEKTNDEVAQRRTLRSHSSMDDENSSIDTTNAINYDEESRRGSVGNVSLESTVSVDTKRILKKEKVKKKKKGAEVALLIVKIMQAKNLILSSKFDATTSKNAPSFDISVSMGRGKEICDTHSCASAADAERSAWTSPVFDASNAQTAFAFQYIVGKSGQPLRIVIGQRIKESNEGEGGDSEAGLIDILGQCVMKFPPTPLLNRSIRLTHPIGPCVRSDILRAINSFDEGDVCKTLTAERKGGDNEDMGELKYKCIILQREFLHSLLLDDECNAEEPKMSSDERQLFVLVKVTRIDKLGGSPTKKSEDTVYRPWIVVSALIGTGTGTPIPMRMGRSSRSKAPEVAVGGSVDWQESADTSFALYCQEKSLRQTALRVDLRSESVSQKPSGVLARVDVADLDKVPINRAPAIRSCVVKNAEGFEMGSVQLEITVLDPHEIARRCDVKAEQYKKRWKRTNQKTASEKKKLLEKSHMRSLLTRTRKNRQRAKQQLMRKVWMKKAIERAKQKSAEKKRNAPHHRDEGKIVEGGRDDEDDADDEDNDGSSSSSSKVCSSPNRLEEIPEATEKVRFSDAPTDYIASATVAPSESKGMPKETSSSSHAVDSVSSTKGDRSTPVSPSGEGVPDKPTRGGCCGGGSCIIS
eukprot:g3273.t1